MQTSENEKTPIKVLLVEDDPRDVELIMAALTVEIDCRLRVALTEESFEKELNRELPDIIVSDSNVLAFEGIAALKIAREKHPQIPFVFCSGNFSDEKQKEALQAGASSWVSKDNRFAQLVAVVKKLTGR